MLSTIRSVAATTASVATMNSSTASVVRWRARCWCSKKFMLGAGPACVYENDTLGTARLAASSISSIVAGVKRNRLAITPLGNISQALL